MMVVGGLLIVVVVGLVSYVASRHFLLPTLISVDTLSNWSARAAPAMRWLPGSVAIFNDSTWRFANGSVLSSVAAQSDTQFSSDFAFALSPSAVQSVFRHSAKAEFTLVDVRAQKKLRFAFSDQLLRNVLFDSAPGSADLAVVDDAFDVHVLAAANWAAAVRVTSDGSVNVSNGVQNWLYEEEIYGDSNAMRFRSPFLAFLRSDESSVPVRTIPLYSTEKNEPDHWNEHYSQVGDPIPLVTLRVFDRRANTTVVVQHGSNPYIVSFDFVDIGGDGEPMLFVQTLTRKQDELEAFRCRPSDGTCTLAYKRQAHVIQWVDVQPIVWHDGAAYQIEQLVSERVISRRLLSALDQPLDLKVRYTPIAIIGFDSSGALWYKCAHPDPASQRVCVVGPQAEKMLAADAAELSFALREPSSEPLFSSASLSPDGTMALASYLGPAVPFASLLETQNVSRGAVLLESNERLRTQVAAAVMLEKEFFNVTLSDDFVTSAWIMNANAAKNGIIFNTYGGPDAVFVNHAYSIGINHVLATELDIAVAGADVGGAGLRGVQFLKRCSPLLGNAAARDSNTVMAFLKSKHHAPRIGMHGWSFGGSTSAKSLTLPDAPDFAIAVAPVTDWRLYDAAYTERYTSSDPAMVMFNQTSLLGATCSKMRNDSLLLMHGTNDDNVHYLNTAALAFCLTQAGVRFQMRSFINKNHGISGNGAREAVYSMMISFIRDQLK
jgi:dipeptidyl aminopeptidase/acylaminoacyl peptidase